MRHPLRTLPASLALSLLAAACTGGSPAAPPQTLTEADFIPGSNVIEVVTVDPLALGAAELVAPDGSVTAASEIRRSARLPANTGYGLGPSVGVGIGGGSRSGISTGIGIGFPIFTRSAPAAASTTESRAALAVPDMAAYSASWQDWRLRLSFGTATEPSRVAELAAPPPPPPPGAEDGGSGEPNREPATPPRAPPPR